MAKTENIPTIEWARVRELAESGNVEALLGYVDGSADGIDRIRLYAGLMRDLQFKEWRGKSMDTIAAVGQAGIEYGVGLADNNPNEYERLLDAANILAYNLSANLAECWGDSIPRQRRHFELGLAIADKAIAFRKRLSKGPAPFSMAYWARGMHQFSLRQFTDAEESFRLSLDYAVEAAREQGKSGELNKDSTFGVVLGHGYLALSRIAGEHAEARASLQEAIAVFEEMKGLSEQMKNDAEFGIQQLQLVEGLFGEKK